MADKLTEIRAQILKKDKAAVKALLGKPLKVGYWTTTQPPQRANRAAMAAFRMKTLDEIWIYARGRVHFNLVGKAVKVDDRTSRDLPPNENIV
jgi:hypothetical protein